MAEKLPQPGKFSMWVARQVGDGDYLLAHGDTSSASAQKKARANQLRGITPEFTHFTTTTDRTNATVIVSNLSDYVKDNAIKNVVFIDRKARPMGIALSTFWRKSYQDEKRPFDIYFVNPRGFLTPPDLAVKSAPGKLSRRVKEVIHSLKTRDAWLTGWGGRTNEKIRADFEESYPKLLKNADEPTLVFDTNIRTGSTIGPVVHKLSNYGFTQLRIGVICNAGNESSITPDFTALDITEETADIWGNDMIVKKPFDDVHSMPNTFFLDRTHSLTIRREVNQLMKQAADRKLLNTQGIDENKNVNSGKSDITDALVKVLLDRNSFSTDYEPSYEEIEAARKTVEAGIIGSNFIVDILFQAELGNLEGVPEEKRDLAKKNAHTTLVNIFRKVLDSQIDSVKDIGTVFFQEALIDPFAVAEKIDNQFLYDDRPVINEILSSMLSITVLNDAAEYMPEKHFVDQLAAAYMHRVGKTTYTLREWFIFSNAAIKNIIGTQAHFEYDVEREARKNLLREAGSKPSQDQVDEEKLTIMNEFTEQMRLISGFDQISAKELGAAYTLSFNRDPLAMAQRIDEHFPGEKLPIRFHTLRRELIDHVIKYSFGIEPERDE